MGDVKPQSAVELPDKVVKEIRFLADKKIQDFKKQFERGVRKGQITYMRSFPMDSWVPMALVYRSAPYVDTFKIQGQYVYLGTSFHHFGYINDEQNK
jgi:hypothetical protein